MITNIESFFKYICFYVFLVYQSNTTNILFITCCISSVFVLIDLKNAGLVSIFIINNKNKFQYLLLIQIDIGFFRMNNLTVD